MRVLVVEDEPDVGNLFLDSLTELGHQPSVVPTAEDALTRLATERPDVIILDIMLPGMSGLDFLQLRPIEEYGVPILAISGVASESQARECLRLGAADFLAKPLSLKRLRDALAGLEARGERARPSGTRERRRAARARIEVPVRVIEDSGAEWRGTSVDLSPFGIKVRSATEPGGPTVTISFELGDDGPPVVSRALVLRHTDGYAFYFVNLSSDDFRRITDAVERRLGG